MADIIPFLWGNSGQKLSQDDVQNLRDDAARYYKNSQQTPATNWAQGMANVLNSFLGGYEEGQAQRASEKNDADAKAALANALGQNAVGTTESPTSSVAYALNNSGNPQPTPTVETPVSQAIASGVIGQDYANHVAQAESGGNALAQNPSSSALGAYQFTSPTWRALMDQHPELGLTADGRTDPAQSQAAAQQLGRDNIAYMLAKGIQSPTEGQTYLAHFAGAPAATRVIQADPSAPVSSILSPQQVAANPFLSRMSAGDLQDWAAHKMGDTTVPQMGAMAQINPPAQPQAPQVPQAMGSLAAINPLMPGALNQQQMGALAQIEADPSTPQRVANMAHMYLQNGMNMQMLAQQQQLRQADPLYQSQINMHNAQTQALQGRTDQRQQGYSLLSGQQAQQLGLDPTKAYQMGPDGKISQVGGNGVNVTLNNGQNTSEFQKKSDDAAAERLGGYIQEGAAAPALVGQLQQLSDLSRNIGTGKGAQFLAAAGPYAQALGVDVKGLSDTQAFNAIIDRMAPQMRAVGSGSSSDTDVRMFLNALPSLGNTDRGNQVIVGTMQALQQNKMQAADIASQAQRGQITWQDAETQIRKLPSPYEQFKAARPDLIGAQSTSGSPSAQPASGARSGVTSSGLSWSIH